MRLVDITETIANTLEKTIYDEWKHEGHIESFSSDAAYMVIDGKRYCILVMETKKGEDGKDEN